MDDCGCDPPSCTVSEHYVVLVAECLEAVLAGGWTLGLAAVTPAECVHPDVPEQGTAGDTVAVLRPCHLRSFLANMSRLLWFLQLVTSQAAAALEDWFPVRCVLR